MAEIKKAQSRVNLADLPFLGKARDKRQLISFDLELTPRCNNHCRHCYINLPAYDSDALKRELTLDEINKIADDAVSLGAIWCNLTGGEPLLRKDFKEIYMYLKKKGLLVSIMTNATCFTENIITLFKQYPPRDIEITVYSISKAIYEKISRVAGSYERFMKGLQLLKNNGIGIRLKAMALKSNLNELTAIKEFCKENTKDYFRIDSTLQLRYDGSALRNKEIREERLSPEQIVALEMEDEERTRTLQKACDLASARPDFENTAHLLFTCGTGCNHCVIGYNGTFRLCASLTHPACIYDLRKGNLIDAWQNFVPQIRRLRTASEQYLSGCSKCKLANLCSWCPANAYLESHELVTQVEYFCKIAHLRMEHLRKE